MEMEPNRNQAARITDYPSWSKLDYMRTSIESHVKHHPYVEAGTPLNLVANSEPFRTSVLDIFRYYWFLREPESLEEEMMMVVLERLMATVAIGELP